MKAYDYVEKLLNECKGNQGEFGIRLKNSLVRLTKRYNTTAQEEIITKIIKGDIFAYIFIPEIPREYAITVNEPIQCGIALLSQPPTIDDLPKGTDAGYILVKHTLTLYFINKLDKDDKIKSFFLNEHEFDKLISELEIGNDSQIIPLLSNAQQNLIKEFTGHIPIILRLSSTYPKEWLALTPSQANAIIQNPKDKNIIMLGERYGAADIDCLWVVKHEADELVADIDGAKGEPIPSSQNDAKSSSGSNQGPSKEDMYQSMELSDEERKQLTRILQTKLADPRNQFIQESVDSHIAILKEKFPHNKPARQPIIRALHTLHKPLYDYLKFDQPGVDSYITFERAQRRSLKLSKK